MKKAEIFYDCSNHLGEGPIWSNDQQTLYWLDIPMPSKLFKLHLPTNNLESIEMPEMISALAVRPNNDLLIASHSGINNFNPNTIFILFSFIFFHLFDFNIKFIKLFFIYF